MKIKKILFICVAVLITISVNAQLFSGNKFPRKGEEAETFEKAEVMFKDENYLDALVEYEKIEKDNPEETIIIFRLGVCYLHLASQIKKALQYLEKIDKVKLPHENVEYYLAQAYHKNSKYQDALTHFEAFNKNKNADKELKKQSEKYILNCTNGVELSKNMLPYIIKNIGAPINTIASEYAPVITSDESYMMFTYSGSKSIGGLQEPFNNPKSKYGEYYEDVFYTVKNSSGNWEEPKQLTSPINNEQNNSAVSISSDGQKLFLFNSIPGELGSISFSNLFGDEWTTPEMVAGGVNIDSQNGNISLSSNQKVMIFASERAGGFGGIDLYSAQLMNDFSWGNVKNLGPEINTSEDEHGPFLHPSGQFFIFSSKGHNSVGGYDLFKCLSITDSTWKKPENMGLPLNTPLDDLFYVISGDGKHGYYSSGKAGGFGEQDIYMTTPSIFGVNIYLAQLKGNVTLNDEPVFCEIKITTKNNPDYILELKSNEVTGKYLVDLEPGNEYLISYTVAGLAPQTRALDATKLNEFKAYEINVQFYKKDIAAVIKLQYLKPGLGVIEEVETINGKFSFKNVFDQMDAYFKLLVPNPNNLKEVYVANPELKVGTALLEADGYYRFQKTPLETEPEITIKETLSKHDEYENEELTYHVQIGAFNFPDNFRNKVAAKFGKVEKQILDDNITRFVIGSSHQLSEMQTLCKKIVDAGITDAFVTGEYRGKRYTLRELALNKFFSE